MAKVTLSTAWTHYKIIVWKFHKTLTKGLVEIVVFVKMEKCLYETFSTIWMKTN